MTVEFQAGAKQLGAVVLMLAAIGVLTLGEVAIGLALIGAAAVLSVGGMFYDAHQADVRVAALRASGADTDAAGKKVP